MNKYKYNIMYFDLTNGISEQINVEGGYFLVKDATDIDVEVYIKPNDVVNDAIYMKKGEALITHFDKIYLYADAQVGKFAEVMIASSIEDIKYLIENISDINSISTLSTLTTITNDVNTNLKKVNGTTQTARDLSLDSKAVKEAFDPNEGTQIAVSLNGTGTIYTVTAGKKLILDFFSFQANNNGSANYRQELIVTNASDVLQYVLAGCYMSSSTSTPCSTTGNPFLVIPAGYKITAAVSAGGGISSTSFIKGREFTA